MPQTLSPRLVPTLLSALALLAGAASAQVVTVPAKPQVGSSNPVTAEPRIARPPTRPCSVFLLKNQAFADFSAKPLAYTPPAACPSPWAKVVLTADFTVSAGRQYDRTAQFFLGDANLFYGTTAEPRRTLSPSWHVERDLTDLSALLETPQTGAANIGNLVNSTYTGIIYVSARIEFYPASAASPAPRVPDIVVPVSSGNGAGTLNTTADQVTQTLNLPRNVERAYLDVIAQSQYTDEFWYLNVPNDQIGALQSYGNTAFRETEITIDGAPAGVAPVFPWIYTGGLDPYLWEPIPGVQTLNFKPYRVDLTPFAGLLADGNPHTLGIGVFNANSYFLAAANLLVFTDHGRAQTGGALVENTLTLQPTPQVSENLATDAAGTVTGTVEVGSNRQFLISGYVHTSHGRVDTTVTETVNFLSTQTFNVNANAGFDVQNAVQTSTVDSRTATANGLLVKALDQHISFPLTVDYSFVTHPDGTGTQVVTVDQGNFRTDITARDAYTFDIGSTDELVHSTDTLQFSAAGALLAPGIGTSTASFVHTGANGGCFSRTLEAKNQVLTSVTDGARCPTSAQ